MRTSYSLMKLLGHEPMVASQQYVTAAGAETPHRRISRTGSTDYSQGMANSFHTLKNLCRSRFPTLKAFSRQEK